MLGVLGLLLIVFVLFSGNASATDSGPVHYVGDTELAASPLVTGSGTEGDPYVFADHEFECAGSAYGLWIQGTTSHARIDNCTFLNCTTDNGYAINLDDVSNVDVEGCRFSNCYSGIYAYLSDNCTFHNNDLNSTSDTGIYISGSYWMEAIGNHDITDDGPRARGVWVVDSTYVAINDTELAGGTFGIGILSSTSVIVENATIYGTSAYGLDLRTVSDVRITNSTVSDIGETYYAINAYDVSHIDISGNHFSSMVASTHGIYLSDSDNATISNNSIDTSFRSIDVYRCENVTIEGNLCTNSTDYVMHLIMTDGQVLNNTVRNSTIGLFMQDSANVIVSGNQLELLQGEGFNLYQCQGIIIEDNYVTFTLDSFNKHILLSFCSNCQILNNTALGYGNTAFSIYSSTGLLVAGNYMASVSAAGINLETVGGAEVLNNTVGTAPEYGLLVRNSYDLHLAGNVLEGCTIYGISLDGSYDVLVEDNDVDLALSRGISVSSGGTYSNITILNNSCLYTQTGIVISEIGGVVVEGNDCSFGINGGIYFSHSVLSYAGNNTAHDCGVGIALDDSPGCMVNGGSFDDCNVGVSIGNDGVSISNVSASNCGIYGLLVNNAPYSFISGSYFNGNTYGIVINLDEDNFDPVFITDCHIENNTETGLSAYGGIFSEISGNHFAYNIGYAVDLGTTCQNWFFFNNTFLENNYVWGINLDAYQAYDRGVDNYWYSYQGDRNYGNGWSNLPNVDRDPLDGYVDYSVWIGGSYDHYQYQMPYGPMIGSPSAPTGMTGVIDLPYIWLNWTEPGFGGNSSILTYEVYQGFAPDSLSMLGHSYGDLFYIVNYDLMNGLTYYYAVKAVNMYGFDSELSEIVEVNYTLYPLSNFSPFVIHSDQEFYDMDQANGWPGDGSADDPYIISDLIIDGNGWEDCVQIWDTTAHFIIRNCTFYYGYLGMSGDGIELRNVINALIVDCDFLGQMEIGLRSSYSQFTVEGCEFTGSLNIGVYFDFNNNVQVANSTFLGCNTGLSIYDSEGLVISNNTFEGHYYAIYAYMSGSIELVENYVNGSRMFEMYNVHDILIAGNEGVELGSFAYLSTVNNAEIVNNTVSGTQPDSFGIFVSSGNIISIDGNDLSDFRYGIIIDSGDYLQIIRNHLNGNDFGLYVLSAGYISVTDNNISGNLLYGIHLGSGLISLEAFRNVFIDNIGYAVYIETQAQAMFYLNLFQGNNGNNGTYDPSTVQVYDKFQECQWDYEGLGNYWADWTSPDDDGDGIVDIPYGAGGEEDYLDFFPLSHAFGAPIGLQATAGITWALLSWEYLSYDFSDGVDGYYVYMSEDGVGYSQIGTTTLMEYNATGLTTGFPYYFRITAFIGAEEGMPSQPLMVTPCDVPGAPTGLTVVRGAGTLTLNWVAPTNDGGAEITGYSIWRGTSPETLTLLATVPTDLLEYGDGSLGNGVTFYYAVRAINQAGAGAPSAIVGNTTFDLPGVPLSVETQFGDGNVTVSWQPPSDDGGTSITGYVIEVSYYGGDGYYYPGPSDRSWLVSGLTNGELYSFRVRAVNDVGDGDLSSAVDDTPAVAPDAPTALKVVPGEGTASLSWLAPSDDGGDAVSSYNVYRWDLATTSWTKIAAVSLLEYEDSAVSDGSLYRYRVTAVNKAGEGAPSDEVQTVPGLPLAPTGLTAIGSSGKVLLNWTAPADDGGSAVMDYKVYRDDGSGYVYIGRTGSAALTYLDGTASPGIEYTYRVNAVTMKGEGAPSNLAVITLPLTIPEAPIIDSALRGNEGVLLTWHMPDSSTLPDDLLVYRGDSPDGLSLIAVLDGSSSEYLDLAGEAGMYYALRASNQYGVGNMSEAFLATIGGVVDPDIPAPSYLLATVGNGTVTLAWDPMISFNVNGFAVYRSDGGNFTLLTVQVGSSYTDDGLVNGVTYTYLVYAFIGPTDGENVTVEATPGTVPWAADLSGQVAVDRITLSWNAPTDGGSAIMGYRLYRTPGTGTRVLLASLTGTTYVDDAVLVGVNYTYMVTALNAFGEGAPSNVVVLRTSQLPEPDTDVPNAPYLSSVIGGNASISLLWNVPSDTGDGPLTGYNIYRGSSALSLQLLVMVPAGTTTYKDSTAAYGTTYYYVVSALNHWGESESSRVLSASLIEVAAPGTVDADAQDGQGRITLTWSAPDDEGSSPITGYNIYRRAEGGERLLIATVPSGTDSFVDGSVEVGTEYEYWVTAVNAAGEGELPDEPATGVPMAVITGEAQPGLMYNIGLVVGILGLAGAVVAIVLVLRKK
ncbi:MAG: right-handed parallel beta-helix repeat-containing protein [Methanomassiliicoccales archaeon]